MTVYTLDLHHFLPFKDNPGRYLVPFNSDAEFTIELDYSKDKFTVLDPYTEIKIEKLKTSRNPVGGLPFFNCPKCTIRVQQLYIDTEDDEVCCKYCMSLKEIDMNA